MQKHLSVFKRARQNEKNRLRNTQTKKLIKTAIKKINEKVETGSTEEAKSSLLAASSIIDKAASKGIIHKRNASRKISSLSRKVSSLTKKSDT